tara:strand:+ start:161 stop:334 length:174 start_codon:yes stop_codon:yes gene_type:complete
LPETTPLLACLLPAHAGGGLDVWILDSGIWNTSRRELTWKKVRLKDPGDWKETQMSK